MPRRTSCIIGKEGNIEIIKGDCAFDTNELIDIIVSFANKLGLDVDVEDDDSGYKLEIDGKERYYDFSDTDDMIEKIISDANQKEGDLTYLRNDNRDLMILFKKDSPITDEELEKIKLKNEDFFNAEWWYF